MLERPDLLQDPRFASNSERMANLSALVETLTETFRTRPTHEWLRRIEEAGVPGGPMLTLDQVYADPHVHAREMDMIIEHPVAGPVHAIGFPVKYSATPGRITRPAPVLGQHSLQILRELGVSDEECRRLESEGVIHVGRVEDAQS